MAHAVYRLFWNRIRLGKAAITGRRGTKSTDRPAGRQGAEQIDYIPIVGFLSRLEVRFEVQTAVKARGMRGKQSMDRRFTRRGVPQLTGIAAGATQFCRDVSIVRRSRSDRACYEHPQLDDRMGRPTLLWGSCWPTSPYMRRAYFSCAHSCGTWRPSGSRWCSCHSRSKMGLPSRESAIYRSGCRVRLPSYRCRVERHSGVRCVPQ